MPEFSARSRREGPARDVINARNNELWQNSAPVLQAFSRPEPSMPTYDVRKDRAFYDQQGIPSRNQKPVSIPAPPYDPNGSKLDGNPYFDQYAPSFDSRNVARELNGSISEPKQDRGVIESQRILSRGFMSRYVPEGFVESSVEAFESLRPKIDDATRVYRNYE